MPKATRQDAVASGSKRQEEAARGNIELLSGAENDAVVEIVSAVVVLSDALLGTAFLEPMNVIGSAEVVGGKSFDGSRTA